MSMILDPGRKASLDAGFAAAFGGQPARYFSAPGRTEIGGNHTDHQGGCVLAAAVNLDTVAAVRINGTDTVRILSEGYPMYRIPVSETAPLASEQNTTPALIRGIITRFREMGCQASGFDAYCMSQVSPGSGLSSSAAFEVLLGTVINHLFFEGKADPAVIAGIGQYAENVFFGKPCGLMDQTASALGGLVTMDFSKRDRPVIRSVDFDFSAWEHSLCIIHTGGDHANLTREYAAIPGELKAVCACFGKEVLTQVAEEDFYAAIPQLRRQCGDRAVLRGVHEYQENRRVLAQVNALEKGDFHGFLRLVKESGYSSWMYLQNVIPIGQTRQQPLAVALALCDQYLTGRGAFRVHGGGFAGTVQAFVPNDLLSTFRRGIEAALGQGTCQVLSIRSQGGVEIIPKD